MTTQHAASFSKLILAARSTRCSRTRFCCSLIRPGNTP